MNIVQLQEQLKNFSQEQLVREMQMPSGNTPQFLVLGEIMRRKKMQEDFAAQQGGAPQSTVAEDAVAAAGVPQAGLAGMARNMAPQTDMAQNTGVVAMATGGPVKKMAKGDKIVRGGKILTEQEDGSYKDERGRTVRSAEEDLLAGIASFRAIPSRAGEALSDISASMADEANARLIEQSRALQGEQAFGMRAGPDTSYRYPEVPAVDVSAMDRVGMALEGRSGFPTGMPTPQELAMAAAQPSLPPAPLPAFGPGFEYAGRSTPAPVDREQEAIAARNELLGGLVSRFDQQAMMEPGAGRSGFATDEGESAYDRIMRAAAASTAPGGGQGLPTGPAPIPERGLARQAQFEPSYPESPETPRKIYQPPPAPDRSGTTGTNVVPDVAGAIASIPEFLSTEVRIGPDGTVTTVPPEKEPAGRADRDQQGAAAIPTVEEVVADRAAREAATKTTTQPPAGGGGGGGGGAGGAGGMSSYEQELMNMLNRREKAAQQDKWLALAQVGLNLMASTQPTLLGALGEAGVKGVEAARTARDQYDKDRLDLLGEIEQSRAARAAAAARSARSAASGGIGGLKLKDYLGQLENVATSKAEQLKLITGGMDPTMAIEAAIEAGDNARASEIKSAYDATIAAYREYDNTVAFIGGAGATPVEEDDTNIDAADQ